MKFEVDEEMNSTSSCTLRSSNEEGPSQLGVKDHARKDVNTQTELETEPENARHLHSK